jgi:hypothetical protein
MKSHLRQDRPRGPRLERSPGGENVIAALAADGRIVVQLFGQNNGWATTGAAGKRHGNDPPSSTPAPISNILT